MKIGLVTNQPKIFPYQHFKLAQETEVKKCKDVAWRIFRTNHVVGRGSLLGCIPGHNRDPLLLDTLRKGTGLRLAHRGNVALSFVHSIDLAAAMLDLIVDPQTCQSAINVVHPAPVRADDYYHLLAEIIDAPKPEITTLDVDPNSFWGLTAKNNTFTSSHPSAASLTFRYDLRSALNDAVSIGDSNYLKLGAHMKQRIAKK